MNRWVGLCCSLFLCIGVLIVLPKLFTFQPSLAQLKGNIMVFNPHSSMVLTNDNLVDTLSSLPLTVLISRVEWSKSILSLDLKVVSSDDTVEDIYENLAEVISFSFENTTNVDRLMLRLVVENKWLNTRHLLLAADVSRPQWSTEMTQALKGNGENPLPEHLLHTFHMTETKLWRNQFYRH
ncbi:hypothetical protein [Paenibacillus crassostreae]|uniref:Uncharacterized protein n=1 Tax=Paenibacillus crassostreae TaxID=1763538 RepID=A0A167DJU6_9BACL|nr:hypothetical protein [Paenibacillus crassostreae]AOZ91375.1 hypothetical protein LPB68_03570 [Paenibacillus crassostreae]OAB74466.1 hypothetical protein PNBC_10390 [Paenibacillus crassostreae]